MGISYATQDNSPHKDATPHHGVPHPVMVFLTLTISPKREDINRFILPSPPPTEYHTGENAESVIVRGVQYAA